MESEISGERRPLFTHFRSCFWNFASMEVVWSQVSTEPNFVNFVSSLRIYNILLTLSTWSNNTIPTSLSGFEITKLLLFRNNLITGRCWSPHLDSSDATDIPEKVWARLLSLALKSLLAKLELGFNLASCEYRTSMSTNTLSRSGIWKGTQKSSPWAKISDSNSVSLNVDKLKMTL